jgi:hypothetical protein
MNYDGYYFRLGIYFLKEYNASQLASAERTRLESGRRGEDVDRFRLFRRATFQSYSPTIELTWSSGGTR